MPPTDMCYSVVNTELSSDPSVRMDTDKWLCFDVTFAVGEWELMNEPGSVLTNRDGASQSDTCSYSSLVRNDSND